MFWVQLVVQKRDISLGRALQRPIELMTVFVLTVTVYLSESRSGLQATIFDPPLVPCQLASPLIPMAYVE